MRCLSSSCTVLLNLLCILFYFALSFPLLGGCSPQSSVPPTQKETQKETQKSTPTVSSQKSTPQGSTFMVDGETYQIYYPTKPLNANQGQQIIKVVPKPGYKVNQDFPHRMKVSPSQTLKIKASTLKGEITQKQLHYTMNIEGENGKHALQGTADFSICNESMCKLYRATPVEWTTQIQTP